MNNHDSILSAVLAGGGLAMLATHMTGEHIRDSRLLAVLEDYILEDVPIHAVSFEPVFIAKSEGNCGFFSKHLSESILLDCATE